MRKTTSFSALPAFSSIKKLLLQDIKIRNLFLVHMFCTVIVRIIPYPVKMAAPQCWILESSLRVLFSYDFNPICMHHAAVYTCMHYVRYMAKLYVFRYTMCYPLYYLNEHTHRHARTHITPS